MKPKTRTFFILATVFSAIAFGGIHLGLRDEVSKLQAMLDISYINAQQASSACRFDPLECPRAELFGSYFDRDLTELQEARRQASLFAMLALVVPAALVVLARIARRLSPARTGQREKSVQPQSAE